MLCPVLKKSQGVDSSFVVHVNAATMNCRDDVEGFNMECIKEMVRRGLFELSRGGSGEEKRDLDFS